MKTDYKPLKIAFCISGETREYNSFFAPDTMITHLMEMGHTVDIFGHTWAHCEKPQTDIFNFKRLHIDDQEKVIGDWVSGNAELRSWSEHDSNVLQHLDVTRAKIGQHVSGIKCLQFPETDDYDVFYRWRWDLGILPEKLEFRESSEYDQMINEFNKWTDWIGTHNRFAACITDNTGWLGRHWWGIQDTHFMLNKLSHRNVKNMNWEKAIEKVWHDYGKWSYHALWNHLIIDEANTMIGQKLPDLLGFSATKRHKTNELFD